MEVTGQKVTWSSLSSTRGKPRVAVIGAGVIGLSVGLCLSETYKHQIDVSVMADRFSPHTTSDRAGGLILPYFAGSAKADDKVKLWTRITFDYLKALQLSCPLNETGINFSTCYTACRKANQPVPSFYRELMLDFKILSEDEAARLKLPTSSFAEFWSYKTMVVEGERYLPWLTQGFQRNGGLIERRRINSFDELSNYDVVINCTGLGSRELTEDKTVYPVRGQIVTVSSQRVKECYEILEDPATYIIPHQEQVLLGGSEEEGIWSTVADPNQARSIFEKCLELVPTLRGSTVTGGWACLRPVRKSVRLEVESAVGGDGFQRPTVIHNYGHGGQGYVLHWGCAMEVVKLVGTCVGAQLSKL